MTRRRFEGGKTSKNTDRVDRSSAGPESKGLSRRAFLVGGSLVFNAAAVELVRELYANNAEAEASVAHLQERGAVAERVLATLAQSPRTKAKVRTLKRQYPVGDDYLGKRTVHNDPEHRSRIEYLRDMLLHAMPESRIHNHIPEAVIEHLEKTLPFFWVGAPGVESNYDNDAVSHDRHGEPLARHLGQITDETWEDFGRSTGEHVSLEDRKYLVNQVKVMQWKIHRVYATLTTQASGELARIRSIYFNNNEEQFIEQFLIFALISGYHTGEGNITNVVKKFADQEKIPGIAHYDVMTHMFEQAQDGSFDPDFQGTSAEYPLQVFACALAINGVNTTGER